MQPPIFLLCPSTCPWLEQRQRRTFQVVIREKRNASHDFSVGDTGQPIFQSGAVSHVTPLIRILKCTATARASAVVTVEAVGDIKKFRISSSRCFFIAMTVSTHRVLNDCTFIVLQFDLQNLIQVQERVVRVADLEVLTDHPCDLRSREKAFSFYAAVCKLILVTECDVFSSAIDFADS